MRTRVYAHRPAGYSRSIERRTSSLYAPVGTASPNTRCVTSMCRPRPLAFCMARSSAGEDHIAAMVQHSGLPATEETVRPDVPACGHAASASRHSRSARPRRDCRRSDRPPSSPHRTIIGAGWPSQLDTGQNGAHGGQRRDRGSTPRMRCLAGAAGFEPADGGTKSRCLTTWRRPNGGGLIAGSAGVKSPADTTFVPPRGKLTPGVATSHGRRARDRAGLRTTRRACAGSVGPYRHCRW